MTDADYMPEYDDPRPDNPTARPTEYTISCLPDTIPDADSWHITVERVPVDPQGRWRITRRNHWTLNADGAWDLIAPVGGQSWKAAHWFPFAEAIERAKGAAPHVIVNGMTPADVLAWHEAGCPLPIPRPHSRAKTQA